MALVAFDNTILSVLLFPDADLRQGVAAEPVDRARERVDGLVQDLAATGEHILIPTPALAEVLATPGCDMDQVLSALRVSAYIRIGDFDLRAAVELAIRLRDAAAKGDVRDGLTITKSRMKFDRQIVAIALTNGARVLLRRRRWRSKVRGRLRAECEANFRSGDTSRSTGVVRSQGAPTCR